MSAQTVAAEGMVHEADLDELARRVARINAQARKLGVVEVRVEHTGKEELRTVKKELKLVATDAGTVPQWVPTVVHRYVEVRVLGEQPKLPGGWRLAAVVDYRQSVPLVSMVPGEELPLDPRGYGARCDHCGTSRQRADVFVLANEAGEGRQVGRNCLGDFLGLASNNPASALGFFARLRELVSFDEEERAARGFRGPAGFYLEEVMVLSAAIVNVSGWVSRARADAEHIPSTSSRINSWLFPPTFSWDGPAALEYRTWRAAVAEQLKGWKELCVEAREARQWVQECGSDGGSEFERELADIARCDFLQSKYLGRAAYILPGYRKAQERLREAERRRDRWGASAHRGELGKRAEFELELVATKLIDGDFGTTTLATFDDGAGNQFKWFASSFPEWKEGERKRVKATVKKHDEFAGIKQTVVSRLTVLGAAEVKL